MEDTFPYILKIFNTKHTVFTGTKNELRDLIVKKILGNRLDVNEDTFSYFVQLFDHFLSKRHTNQNDEYQKMALTCLGLASSVFTHKSGYDWVSGKIRKFGTGLTSDNIKTRAMHISKVLDFNFVYFPVCMFLVVMNKKMELKIRKNLYFYLFHLSSVSEMVDRFSYGMICLSIYFILSVEFSGTNTIGNYLEIYCCLFDISEVELICCSCKILDIVGDGSISRVTTREIKKLCVGEEMMLAPVISESDTYLKRSFDEIFVERKLIGSGTYCDVWKAKTENGDLYAIKTFRKCEEYEWVMIRETSTCFLLESEFVVKTFGYITGKKFACVQELCLSDLSDIILDGKVPVDIKPWCSQLLKGLKYLHEMGIVHRDIKPNNILVSKNEKGEMILKFGDFGLAKQWFYDNGLQHSGEVITYNYRPPEFFCLFLS